MGAIEKMRPFMRVQCQRGSRAVQLTWTPFLKRASCSRFRHILKTFWNGAKGWRDRQLPDGTVVWTSPTGYTYTTRPGSRLLFPSLCTPTGNLWTGEPPTIKTTGDRRVMMPTRRGTRADNSARAIAAERRLNETSVATAREFVNPAKSSRRRAPCSTDPPPF